MEPDSLHPFTINTPLPDVFGYPKKFITGELKWDFEATSGGGRSTAGVVKDMMNSLADLTRQGALNRHMGRTDGATAIQRTAEWVSLC
jgi:hypothetical protein